MTEITDSEFISRRKNAAIAAADRGYDALLIVGSGGGAVQNHGYLQYLTGYYATFPVIPDVDGLWSGRGWGGAVLTLAGDIELSVDAYVRHSPSLINVVGDLSEASIAGTPARFSHDLVGTVVEILQERGLQRARLGVVGTNALSFGQLTQISGRLPGIQFEPADDLVLSLRMIKSETEQELIRQSMEVGISAVTLALDAVDAGVTELELASIAHGAIVRRGARVANVFTHAYGRGRTPGDPLRAEDVFMIDATGALGGYYFDLARSKPVGEPSEEAQRAMSVAVEAVSATVDALRSGVTVKEVTSRNLEVRRKAGLPDREPQVTLAHGLGLGFEPPWFPGESEAVLAKGMCISVEDEVVFGEVGAHVETAVFITDGPPEVLAPLR
jgi:Xaa-Pro aminopeptidase